jgi:hypothetical protein
MTFFTPAVSGVERDVSLRGLHCGTVTGRAN